MLAKNLIPLFRVDSEWTKQNLLPFFDWNKPSEAQLVWQGYLASESCNPSLLDDIEAFFLKTAKHYGLLSDWKEIYIELLILYSMESPHIFNENNLKEAFNNLPERGLHDTLAQLKRKLENKGDKHIEYWDNRIKPFFEKYWPQNKEYITPEIAMEIGQLYISSEKKFSKAFQLLERFFTEKYCVQLFDHRIYRLSEKNIKICDDFPKEALEFLNIIIPKNSNVYGRKLKVCLDRIETAYPELPDNTTLSTKFSRLRKLLLKNPEKLR